MFVFSLNRVNTIIPFEFEVTNNNYYDAKLKLI